MLEIDEIDHALGLARSYLRNGLRDYAIGTLWMLAEKLELSLLSGPAFARATYAIETGHSEDLIDWTDLREVALAAVNVYIIRQEQRAEKELKGIAKVNKMKQDDAAERLALVRQHRRAGYTAEDVRQRLAERGEYISKRTIQRLMKKLHDAEN